MTNIIGTWSGVPIDADAIAGRGYLDPIVVNGATYPRMWGYMAAGIGQFATHGGLLFVASSVTSVAAGAGSQSFVVDAAKGFQIGQTIVVTSTVAPTVWMLGTVTSYSAVTGALVVNVSLVNGSGTYAAWSVTLSGPRGAAGAAGSGTTINAQQDGVSVTAAPRAAINATWSVTAVDDSAGGRIGLKLTGDSAAPGARRVYGTDASGARGWQTGAGVARSARTSNTALAVADLGALIDASGTWTQTLVAAATLGAGWSCWFANSGTGTITIDPNGSETIDGRTTITAYPGESFLIQCDGTAFHTPGRPRGWVPMGTTTIPGGAPTSVDFEAPFGDAEMSSISIEFDSLLDAGGVALTGLVKKGGSYQTSGYAYTTSSDTASYSASASSLPICSHLDNSIKASGRVTVDGCSGAGQSGAISWASASLATGTYPRNGCGMQSTASAAQGFRFASGSSFQAGGLFRVSGYRG